MLYLLLGFHEGSVLQQLDPTIHGSRLIQDRGSGEVCTMTTPEADHELRLFASVVARHLWARLTKGRWRCGQQQLLEELLRGHQRWNNEDWWLETRLRTWPLPLQHAGRGLFHKEVGWASLPPWHVCRESCVRRAAGVVRCGWGAQLPPNWHCAMSHGHSS